jgi:molybdopterin converting factor subunit 1
LNLNIRLFATLKELTGASQISIDIREPATVSDMLDELNRKFPNLQPLLKSILIAVNQTYADRSQPIYSHDEIALFPPVSGG